MKELIEYREKLLARFEEAAKEFCDACRSFKDPFANITGERTIHYLASLVRGVDREAYGLRVRRTLNEDDPGFTNFDPQAWMTEHYDRDEPLENILNEFSESIHEMCKLLAKGPQPIWSRLSHHDVLGKELTLQLWAERDLAHIEEHLAALKRAENK